MLGMARVLKWYLTSSLMLRVIVCFAVGSAIGVVLWYLSCLYPNFATYAVLRRVSPFGAVFVNMLKMIVIPVIFFSLVAGAASLPITKFGRVGLKTLGWYLSCSFLAAGIGVSVALAVNPGKGADLGNWQDRAAALARQPGIPATGAAAPRGLSDVFLNMFVNPFEALATANFLPIIVFSIMLGLAIRLGIETAADEKSAGRLESLIEIFQACRDATFKVVDWVLQYSPVGVLALSIVNFGLYGPAIAGPYTSVTVGVILGIMIMVVGVYSVLLLLVVRQNPLTVFRRMQQAMIMAFITRSSAATLPVSMKIATEKLKIRSELASFSLPLGATINMDGVCVHLPMFAVLAANMFGIELDFARLLILVVTTVLASIGAGGVPGGSLMLLFIILEAIGVTAQQVAVVVALALAINPILDMFETMNNVTGDLVCSYVVACKEGLIAP